MYNYTTPLNRDSFKYTERGHALTPAATLVRGRTIRTTNSSATPGNCLVKGANMPDEAPDVELLRQSREHAWEWFSLHATQRTK